MSWSQIEIKWAEMTNRVRADTSGPGAKDSVAPSRHTAAFPAPVAASSQASGELAHRAPDAAVAA